MCGSTTITYLCVYVRVHVHVHIQSLAGGQRTCRLPYGSLIELKSHQAGQQAVTPEPSCRHIFFISLNLKHALLSTQLANKPLGSIYLCPPASLKVHTIVSGFYMHSGEPNLRHI